MPPDRTIGPYRGPRIASLDIVRGVVMVLMALDHVRVYSGIPAGGPTAGLFFTRWVTHFCAPAFVFLAGTSAYLLGLKLSDRSSLARYLVTRGLLLVVLEVTVIRAGWTFGVDYSEFLLAGVIWMLGWCMVLLAGLIWLPTWGIAAFGAITIVFQNVFGLVGSAVPAPLRAIWEFIYPVGAEITIGASGPSVSVLYVIVPWIGVMAAGYAFGAVMVREPAVRRRMCLRIGLTATALFVALCLLGLLFVPRPDDGTPVLFWMLNQRKYPASVLYLLMTLGPTIALLPAAERARGSAARALATFGRVPMFYYLLHIPVIHATALLVWRVRNGSVHPEWFASAPFVSVPEGEAWGLPLLYAVFALVILMLYFPCRWFEAFKARHSGSWVRYV